MILGLPVMDSVELTRNCVEALAETATGALDFIVVIDNGSETPYTRGDFPAAVPFSIVVKRFVRNEGFYAPLKYMTDTWTTGNALVGLMHNDLLLYEKGWDKRMQECFEVDPALGLVGLCGSYEFDENGGRGGGTMCWFRGTPGIGQSQDAGERISDLRPAVVLDSLFMMFRREAIHALDEDWANLPLAHFYDKIWPLRLWRRGYRVAVLGSEVDHMGGMTCVLNPQYVADCRTWLADRGLPADADSNKYWGDWNMLMYQEAQRRMFVEFGNGRECYPVSVRTNYTIKGRL